MLLLGLILLIVGLVLALAPTGLRPPAVTIGWILVAIGLALILVDVLDVNDASAASAAVVPLSERVRSRLMWWKHVLDKWLDRRALDLACLLPARLRMWVVVDATNTARRMYPDSTGYAGPDGLEYRHIYDGARRTRTA